MYYTLHVLVVEASDIPRMDANYTHACCTVQSTTETRVSSIVPNNMYPRWNQDFHFNITTPTAGQLHISICNKDQYKKDMNVSYIDIPYNQLPLGQVIDRWYDLIPYNRELPGGRIHLVLQMANANSPPFTPSTGFQQPGYTAAQQTYPAGYAAPPGYPAQPTQPYPAQPGYPAPQPGYPVHPGQAYPQPGYAVPQPGYPSPQPGYPAPQPGYPAPQPGQMYPQPGYPQQPYGGRPY